MGTAALRTIASWPKLETSVPSLVKSDPLPKTRPLPAKAAVLTTRSQSPGFGWSWKCEVWERTPVETVRWESLSRTVSGCACIAAPMVNPG